MAEYEYRVVPAPKRGKRGRGVKGPEARFANAMESVMNSLAADGWEYLRTDSLPAEERSGLTARVTVFQHLLVFRRDRGLAEATSDKAADRLLLTHDDAAETPLGSEAPGSETQRADATYEDSLAEPAKEPAQ